MSILSKIGGILSHPNGLKRVLIVKLVAIVVLLAVYRDELFFGEKTSSAESEKPSDLAKAGESAKKSAPAESGPNAKTAGSSASSAETPPAPQEKRKSFLDDLLNLPALSTDGMKRESLGRYMNLAEKKKEQIESRLNLLRTRESQLVTIEKSIDEKLRKLEDERKFFAQTVQQEKDLKGKRLDKLIELYGKMEARKAAPIIEKLDRDLVVELFKNIDKKQAKSILETMDAQKSAEFTEYFGRVRSAKEYDLLRELNVSLRKEFQDCRGMPTTEREDSPLRNPGGQSPNQQGASTAPPAGSVPASQQAAAPAAGEAASAPSVAPAAAPSAADKPAADSAATTPSQGAPSADGNASADNSKLEPGKGASDEDPKKLADAAASKPADSQSAPANQGEKTEAVPASAPSAPSAEKTAR